MTIMAEVPTVELSPEESQPAVDPNETTMWPVTERSNYTSTDVDESSAGTTESNSALELNETSTATYPSSTASGLEGLDYKQSKLNSQFLRRKKYIKLLELLLK